MSVFPRTNTRRLMSKARLLCGVVVALAAIAISACGSSSSATTQTTALAASTKSNVRICYTTNLGDPYSTALADLIKSEAAYYGYHVDVFDIHNDIPTQLTDLMNCVNRKYSAIILQPYDPTALCPAVKAAYAAGIPQVNIENPLSQCTQDVQVFVTDDGYFEGQTAGRLMAQALNGHGKVVMLQGLLNNPIVPGRTNGFTGYLAAHAPGIKVIAEGEAKWDTATAQTVMNDFLTRFGSGGIQGVYAEADTMAFGAINVLKQRGLLNKIKVVSINGSNQEFADIKAGTLYGTVLNDAQFVARNAVQRIRDIEDHVPVMQRYVMPAVGITKSNANEYKGYGPA